MDARALPERVAFPGGAAGRDCPACGSGATELCYAVDRIPVHSCVLPSSAEQARAFPAASMRLAWCRACGFLFNAAFDPGRIDYSEDYEESQGASPTFRAWLEALARELVERHALHGKRVLEIGCGKGELLELVCRLADAEGIGVDPGATDALIDTDAGRGVRLLRERYGPEHAVLDPDAILCRHTLEHVAAVAELVRLVRDNAGERRGVFVFFEVPDVVRVLEEGAFWDIYHEHCSYFGAGSLARLFRACGFEPLELRSAYADQYLQIAARPAPLPVATPPPPDDLGRVERAVARFRESCSASIGRWHGLLACERARGRRTVLWGAGSKATGFLTTLGLEREDSGVEWVVDIDPRKQGRFTALTGQRIVAPDRLLEIRPDLVVVMNPIYVEEIRAELARMGLAPRVLAL